MSQVSSKVLPLLLLKSLNVLLYSPSCNLLHQMPAGLKSPCSSHGVQQVPLLSVGLQADIQTMPLFSSVLWVWWNRNQSLRQPLGEPSQNVANKFHFFSSVSGEKLRIGWLPPDCAMPGRGLGRGRQKHHYISHPFECGCIELRRTVEGARKQCGWKIILGSK